MPIINQPLDKNNHPIDYDDVVLYKKRAYEIKKMESWKEDGAICWELYITVVRKSRVQTYLRNPVIRVNPSQVIDINYEQV